MTTPAPAKRTVLFVDDEPSILDGLKRRLHPLRNKWDMRFVPSGRAALDVLASASIDVIQDMAMCAKVLQIVNSSFFRLSRTIGRIEEAVSYLGFGPLKNIVLAEEVFRYSKAGSKRRVSLDDLQSHALLVGTIASNLVTDKRGKDDAFIAGLLHDIGKLVLVTELPDHLEKALAVTKARVPGNEFGVLAATHVAKALVHEHRGRAVESPLDMAYLTHLGGGQAARMERAGTKADDGEDMSEKILLVDDEPNVLRGLMRTLRAYDVLTFDDARTALVALKATPDIAVIIADRKMPYLDGARFLARAAVIAPHTYRVMLTGEAVLEVAIEAVNIGRVHKFLTKPCSEIMLRKAVEEGLTAHAASQEKQRADEHMQFLALHDPLTNLPNRALFFDRVQYALAGARRSGLLVAAALIDLDRFKPINDTLGHGAGDELLFQVANDVNLCIREVDTVARIGGDEFAAVLQGLPTRAVAEAITERMRIAVSRTRTLTSGQTCSVGASIGLTVVAGGMTSPEELVKRADEAMYEAKRAGGDRVVVWAGP